ncbi:low-density lipoprotein receptor-related protein 12-like [Mercenaria mercenaria]|uniref:low-density lipoprotein receptor-related protein 12-like n=1 Tax=Mercenaria mercenaria TaxID=6596 RepID=UPI001E1D87E3|nr:low-density lipoprotein receptor-related protein 12-like [Mercenaria mercenaria]
MMFLLLAYLISILHLHNVAALYTYYMDDTCNGTVDISDTNSIMLYLTKSSTYKPNMHCSLLISTTKYDQFMLYFKNIDIASKQSGCTQDWLEVHDGNSLKSPFVAGISGRLCGSYISDTVRVSTGNNILLFFVSGSLYEEKGFDMVITQYHTGSCGAKEHSCRNGRCISDSLVCNGYNPCGDNSDCATSPNTEQIVVVIVSIFGSLLALLAISVLGYCIVRRCVMKVEMKYENI